MQRIIVALFVLSPLALPAQTMTSYSQSGETITLPGLPFHAERVTHAERKLADDTIQSRETRETIDRDSAGRVLVESFNQTTGDAAPAKHIVFHVLIDPVVGKSYTWSTASTTAMTQSVGPHSHIRVSASPLTREETIAPPKDGPANQVVTEDLGTRTVAGLTTTGTRTTTTIPTTRFSTSKPLVVVQEIWTSPDLQMTLLEIDKSPFTGTRTSEITSLTRTEPDAALFHLPDGYTVKSFPGGPVNLGVPAPSVAKPLLSDQ